MTLEQLSQQAFDQYRKLSDRVNQHDVADAYVNSLEKQGAPAQHIEIFLCGYNAKLKTIGKSL